MSSRLLKGHAAAFLAADHHRCILAADHHRCIFSRHKDIALVPMAMRPSVFWTIAKARELYEKAHAGDNAARRSA